MDKACIIYIIEHSHITFVFKLIWFIGYALILMNKLEVIQWKAEFWTKKTDTLMIIFLFIDNWNKGVQPSENDSELH